MPSPLLRLPSFPRNGDLNAVVETPRGCSLKLKLDEALGVFIVSRALPAGLTYPYDFGFIPGTKGPDGDPLDVMVLHEQSSYPGILLPCRLIAMLVVDQKNDQGRRDKNNRFLAIPTSNERLAKTNDVADLPKVLREEIEHFSIDTTFHTAKDARLHGWKNARMAEVTVRKASVGQQEDP